MDIRRRQLLGLLFSGAVAADDAPAEAETAGTTAGYLDEDLAGAILTIDLAAIQDNWRLLRARAGKAECAVAVKANAYGLGLAPVSRALWDAGCRTFFVARPRVGERLRGLLPDARIYVLDGLFAGEPGHFDEFRLRPALISSDEARSWAAFCRGSGRRLPCALHVDTGINRLGFGPEELAALLEERGVVDDLSVSLVMSHLACADEPGHSLNTRQLADFNRIRALLPGVAASLANSSGMFLGEAYGMDVVRPGLAIYGGNPTPHAPNPMRQVVRLEGVVMQVRTVAAGETVGYGATWKADRESRVALLGAGYKDGIPRSYSSQAGRAPAEVAISGICCPVIGRISMDMMAVDVTGLPAGSVRQGTRAEIVGGIISLDKAAADANTIAYELLARLGGRFARRYVGGSPE